MSKILILANDETTVIHFRKEIIKAFIENGHNVTVSYPLGKNTEEVSALGCKVCNIDVSAKGKNVIKDVNFFRECKKLIKSEKPDIVLTYTIKPNIYGSIACQRTNTPYINNVTGLGSVLQNQGKLSNLILKLQKIAYRKSSCVFFQNEDNRNKLQKIGVVSANTKTQVLPGSGVNLELHQFEPYPEQRNITKFILVSRVRRDKGYAEYMDAAECLKEKYPNTEFHAVGWYEDKMDNRVDILNEKGVLIFHGPKSQEEVHQLIVEADCLVHPSYHEGMANVLMEAAAAGRPVIASIIPGCRETFEEGVTGFGCEVKSSESLIDTIEKFINTPYEKRVQMGKLGRKKMETEFDRKIVANYYLNQINETLNSRSN